MTEKTPLLSYTLARTLAAIFLLHGLVGGLWVLLNPSLGGEVGLSFRIATLFFEDSIAKSASAAMLLPALLYAAFSLLPAYGFWKRTGWAGILGVLRLLAEWVFLMPDAERKGGLQFHWLYVLDLVLILVVVSILFRLAWKAAFGDWAQSRAYWPTVWRQFRKNKLSLVSLGVVMIFISLALAADFVAADKPLYLSKNGASYVLPNVFTYADLQRDDNFTLREDSTVTFKLEPPVPFGPLQDRVGNKLAVAIPPGSAHFAPAAEGGERTGPTHWLGTDDRGRDVFARVVHGARISLSVGFVAVSLYVMIGLFLGSVAGYFGGWVDNLVSRMTEILLSFPSLILILALMAVVERPGIFTVMVVIGLTGWPSVSRLVRAEILKLKSMDFISAARALGVSPTKIILRHLLPNSLGPVLVAATFGIASAILVEASLSFLGFGVQPPTPSWGELMLQSRQNLKNWWLFLFPGLSIFLSVMVYNLLGEGLRDAVDPKLKRD